MPENELARELNRAVPYARDLIAAVTLPAGDARDDACAAAFDAAARDDATAGTRLFLAWAAGLPGNPGKTVFASGLASGELWAPHAAAVIDASAGGDLRTAGARMLVAFEDLSPHSHLLVHLNIAVAAAGAMLAAGGLDAYLDIRRQHQAAAADLGNLGMPQAAAAPIVDQAGLTVATAAAGNQDEAREIMARQYGRNPAFVPVSYLVWAVVAARLISPGEKSMIRLDRDGLPEAFITSPGGRNRDERILGFVADLITTTAATGKDQLMTSISEQTRHAGLDHEALITASWILADSIGHHISAQQK